MSEFREKLVNPQIYDENLNKCLEKMKQVKEIIIWGASIEFSRVYKFLQKYNLVHKVIAYADNDSKKWGGVLNNVNILSPNEVLEKVQLENNLCIIINTILSSQSKIKAQLISMGINENKIEEKIFYLVCAHEQEYKEVIAIQEERKKVCSILEMHIKEYEKVYSMLEDTHSKGIYLAKLNYRLSGEGKYLKDINIAHNQQYFDEKIYSLKQNEVIVDCGSYKGDTLDNFYIISNGKYKKYIAIEADRRNYEELVNHIEKEHYEKITTYNFACWHEQAELVFNDFEEAGSHLSTKGNTIIKADSLDNLLNEEITILKMDIEGAEQNALRGAEQLIKRYKPILAICIYHQFEDYYKIPLLIKEFNRDYHLFIRHYIKEYDDETICYAIPKERLG